MEGNTTVLLKREDYINKAENFIKEGPYKEIKYDYTSKYQARIKKVMKEITFIDEKRKKYLVGTMVVCLFIMPSLDVVKG